MKFRYVILALILFFFCSAIIQAQTYKATLTWDAVTQTTSGQTISGVTYNAWRADAATGPWAKLNTAAIPAATYVDSTILPNRNYWYAVSAICNVAPCAGNESPKSVAVRFNTGDLLPATPDNLKLNLTITSTLVISR